MNGAKKSPAKVEGQLKSESSPLKRRTNLLALLERAHERDRLIGTNDGDASSFGVDTEVLVRLAVPREPRGVVGVELVIVCSAPGGQLPVDQPMQKSEQAYLGSRTLPWQAKGYLGRRWARPRCAGWR